MRGRRAVRALRRPRRPGSTPSSSTCASRGWTGSPSAGRSAKHEATRDIPIVMLTGLGDTPSKLQGFETGADDYLVKPVPARELAARLRRLIAARVEASTRLHDQRLRVITEIAAAVCEEISAPLAAALGTLDLAMLRPGSPPTSAGTSRSAAPTSGKWPPPWPN
ncbi:MAG: hypothetical protein MZV64_72710 [Ignavibacteriales bacterium]|nr:hypothetical protein [Ignavibacteriales bacterium]